MPAVLARVLAGLVVLFIVLALILGPTRAKELLGTTPRQRTRRMFLVIISFATLAVLIWGIGQTTY